MSTWVKQACRGCASECAQIPLCCRPCRQGSLSLPFSSPFFNEFAVKLPEGTNVKEINSKLLVAGYIGGYDLGAAYPELQGCMLIAVTERRTKEEIDQFIGELEAIV